MHISKYYKHSSRWHRLKKPTRLSEAVRKEFPQYNRVKFEVLYEIRNEIGKIRVLGLKEGIDPETGIFTELPCPEYGAHHEILIDYVNHNIRPNIGKIILRNFN